MRPTPTVFNAGNCANADAKAFGYFVFLYSLGAQITNFPDVIIRKFGMTIFRSFTRWNPMPALLYHIFGVVGGAAQKEMAWIDASRIVAPMAHKQTLWNKAMMQFVRVAVSKIVIFCVKPAVTGLRDAACPFPAIISLTFINESPKAFLLIKDRAGFCVVPTDESHGLTFDPSFSSFGLLSDWRRLTAATFAEFNRGLIRGMIKAHQKLSFLVTSPGRLPRRWAFSIGSY
jgi:hypothetical protein